MTEKLNKNDLREDFWIDRFADKVSKSKLVKALFLGGTVASASQLAACVTPPPAEVAPLNEAVLSGVIGQESVDKLSGNSKIIVENSLAYIGNKYAEDENFVPGTEMIYAVGKGTDSFAWYLAGFKNEDGSVGLRVTDYCDSFVRDNENCQDVEKDLLMVEGAGNRLYGWIDENDEQHPILLIDKENNPIAFDFNGSSYSEKVANSDGFVEKIVSIGAINVQAASPEATATPDYNLDQNRDPFRPDYSVDSGYSEEQIKMIESGSFKDQETLISNMAIFYWLRAKNTPFINGKDSLSYKYLFDYLKPEKAIVTLTDKNLPGYVFYFNINKEGGFKTTFDIKEDGFVLRDNERPLQFSEFLDENSVDGRVSDDLYKTKLINYNGEFVRLSQENKIIGELNMLTGVWAEIRGSNYISVGGEAYESREGLNTIEEIKVNIDDFLNYGNEKWDIYGENKEELFLDYRTNNRLPLGEFVVDNVDDGFSFCVNQVIYLGSTLVEDNDNNERIVGFFGTKNVSNDKVAVEVFMSGFAGHLPDYLSGYKMPYSIVNEKNPEWRPVDSNLAEGTEVLSMLKHNLNQPVTVSFLCNVTDSAVKSVADSVPEQDKSTVEWFFNLSKNNQGIYEWHKGLASEKNNGLIFSSEELNKVLDSEVDSLPLLSQLAIFVPKE